MKAFIAFLFLVMCSVCGAAEEPFCNWDHPGSNKYQKNPVEALNDYYMDFQVRAALKAKMEDHHYDDIVEIRRDGVFGNGVYRNLRDMHYGKGYYCPGSVDTRQWAAAQVERALVYCVDSTCVAVPTVCNNVSLIDRPEETISIDVSPAAGPGPSGASQPGVNSGPEQPGPQPGETDHQGDATTPSTSQEPGVSGSGLPGLVAPGEDGGPTGGGGGGGGFGNPGYPGGGGGGPIGGGGGTWPPGSPGCGCIPLPPVCPPGVPPISTVPETPEWILLLVGALCLWRLWVRRDKRYD